MKTEVDPRELLDRITSRKPPAVLDVRSRAEYAAGHIPGSIHIPFWALVWRTNELGAAADDPIVVYCGHGPRAELARVALRCRGFSRVACLAGHMSGWRRKGYPEE
jgi:rhodanese-related sulfurtransferase